MNASSGSTTAGASPRRFWTQAAILSFLVLVGLVLYAELSWNRPPATRHARLIPAAHTGTAPAATLRRRHNLTIPVEAGALYQCETLNTGCQRMWLQRANADRAAAGSAPLMLSPVQSNGTRDCGGSRAHSRAMAAAGAIFHVDARYPEVSFQPPTYNFCLPWTAIGENVGYDFGSKYQALTSDYALMMSEPWTPGCNSNHHCNILYPGYTCVGIAFTQGGGAWFITEDFWNGPCR